MQIKRLIKEKTKHFRHFSRGANKDFIELSMTSVAVLLIYFIFRVGIIKLTTLSPDAYYQNSIFITFLTGSVKSLFLLIPLGISFVFFRKKIFITWQSFENGALIRKFILFMCFFLAWMFAFYEYNFLVNQSHLIDRIILLVLLPLLFWRPVFLLFFITQVLLIIGQFEVLHGYTRTFPLYAIHMIILFISFFIFRLLGGTFKFVYFVYLAGCVLASQYAFSGVGKVIKDGWITYNQIAYILPNSYANGWLNSFSSATITTITQNLAVFNFPLKLFTLVVELGVLFFFWKRSWTRVLLFSLVFLHIGIFAFSGILFWSWILIDLLVAFLLLKKGLFEESLIFNPKAFILSGCIIVAGYFWSQPAGLAWLDTSLNYTHQLYGETENGKSVYLSPDFFKPFDYQFKLSQFNYLDENKHASIVAGVTNHKIVFDFLKDNRTDSEIFNFEGIHGINFYNEMREKALVAFLQQFISNANNEGHCSKKYLSFLSPPDYLWTHTPFQKNRKGILEEGDKIKNVYVVTKTTYYDSEKGYREIRRDTVRRIPIP